MGGGSKYYELQEKTLFDKQIKAEGTKKIF